MTSAALLATLQSTLRRIDALTPSDKPAWEADEVRRLAIERLWIAAGNLAEAYRKAAELPPGVEPWAELYGFRSVLAHALPGDISSDVSGMRRPWISRGYSGRYTPRVHSAPTRSLPFIADERVAQGARNAAECGPTSGGIADEFNLRRVGPQPSVITLRQCGPSGCEDRTSRLVTRDATPA